MKNSNNSPHIKQMETIIKELEKVSATTVKKRAQTMPITELRALKKKLDALYETGDTGLSDFRYDEIEKILIKRDKVNVDNEFIGDDDEETFKLPYFLGSMQKVKPNDSKKLEKWLKSNPAEGYMISSKLDGISCLVVYQSGNSPKVYTRGRKGTHGRDISWLVGKVPTIPTSVNTDIAVRGELVMPLNIYESKYSKDYDNSRSIVQGLICGYKKGVKDLHFVSYEILNDSLVPSPEIQFKILKDTGFEVVHHQIITDPTVTNLSEILVDYNDNSPYRLDGIIVQSNVPVKRVNKKYPPYALAFKIDGEGADVEVIEVEWNVGQWNTLDPKIVYKETMIGGFKNTHANAHNARKIVDDKIGPGAIVHIIRSGDLIPHLWETVKPAKKAAMPTEFEWEWDTNHVNEKTGLSKKIIAIGPEADRLACIKRIGGFFKKLEIKELGPARIEKMYDNHLDSVIRILGATEEEIVTAVESSAIGVKIHKNIRKGLTNPNIAEIVGASGVLGQGVGRERVESLVSEIPDIFVQGMTEDKATLTKQIQAINGFGDIITEMIVDNLYWASAFATSVEMLSTRSVKVPPPKVLSDRLKDQLYVVTGFTEKSSVAAKDVLETIVSEGGAWTTKWTKAVTGVIAGGKSLEKGSSKITKAEKSDLPVYDVDNFIKDVLG